MEDFKNRQASGEEPEGGEPLARLADGLPYPLGYKVRQWLSARQRRTEGEVEPQYPFLMCAAAGVMIRLAALVAVQAYVDSGARHSGCNRSVVDALRAPADGTWLSLARKLLKQGGLRKACRAAAELHQALGRQVSLPNNRRRELWQALDALVAFRNELIHGEKPDEARLSEIDRELQAAVRGFEFLLSWRLVVRNDEEDWELTGPVPRPLKDRVNLELVPGQPTLLKREGEPSPVPLSPLLRFSTSRDGTAEVELNELYFFNAAERERLSYIGYRVGKAADGKQLGAYAEFKKLMAKLPVSETPPEIRLIFDSLAEFHQRLFVGREGVLEELDRQIAACPGKALVIKAVAGAGKTALVARLHSAHSGKHKGKNHWVFHFCQPVQGCNNTVVMLRSLIAQICDQFGLERKDWLDENLDRLKSQFFPGVLAKVSAEHLKANERLVVAIDALDEGLGGGGGESIPSVLPNFLPDKVVLLLTWRVDENGTNSRVERELKHFGGGFLQPLATANPLRGLRREDVVAFLRKLARDARVEPPSKAGQDAAWEAAKASFASDPPSADPFYLRLLADAVFKRQARLDRPETLPAGLEELFEEMWMNLPTDQNFLLHRILVTVALMQDYADDELLAELYTRRNPDQPVTPDEVAALRLPAGKLLVFDGDRYRLFHDRFRRFLVGEQPDPLEEV